jgi:predicted ATPase
VRDLPSGTVTLFFTDIAGSTRLLQDLGDAYADALAEHRRVLRAAFARHGGIEVDTQGDAFFVAFGRASDAVAAAVEAQAALVEAGRVRVRIGIHTGEPSRTHEGYVGIDVHRAARIAAAGHGGQTLLSQSTRELVDGRALRKLGKHRLKDVGEVELYQVGDETFPPLRSLNQTNLPLSPTPLVGRKRELAELVRMLRVERNRLVTVLGPGGIGKTRLTVEAAAELLPAFDDGVWFVDLSAVRDPQLVEPTIAAALGATGATADHLRDRELLLALDNLEQVADAAPDIGRLLDASPRVAIVATSREPLRLRAEVEYRLAPLGNAPAVELFRQRAHAVDSAFDEDYERLTEVCQRLERIPLAIELAAARVKILSTEQLLARLDRRLPLLSGGARDAPARQRTLRATIEWSYDLLNEEEQRLFARLAVFAGGWTLDAAEQVCEADLDTLHSLVDKSIARAEEGRFRMLETIREYALERLEESSTTRELRGRHADYYLALAEEAEPEVVGPQQHVWLERLAVDYDNLRAALEWYASAPGAGEEGLRLASALAVFWFVRGLYRDGLYWIERMLEASGDDGGAPRAGALWGAGLFYALLGNEERAQPALDQSLDLARRLGDTAHAARSLNVLGLLAFFRNDMRRARDLFEESVELARNADDRWCLADSLGTLSSIYPLQGDVDLADAVGSEGLALARQSRDRQGIRMSLFGLALTAARRGDLVRAQTLAEDGLAVSREIGDHWFVPYFLWILSTVATSSGKYETARAYAEESLDVARQIEGPLLLVCALDALAAVARAEGDDGAARALLTEAEGIGRGAIVPDSYLASVLRALGELAAACGELADARLRFKESLSLARGVGDSYTAARTDLSQAALAQREGLFDEAVGLAREALAVQLQVRDELGIAVSLERLASLAVPDDAARAARLGGAAAAIRKRLGAPLLPWERTAQQRVVELARDALGEAGYDANTRAGSELSLDDAAADAGLEHPGKRGPA